VAIEEVGRGDHEDQGRQRRLVVVPGGLVPDLVRYRVGPVAGNILWGYLGDHGGHKRLVEGGALGTAFGAGAALASHAAADSSLGVFTYGLAFVLVCLGTSAVQLASTTLVLDFGTDADRPAYISLAALGQLPFACGGSLLAGVLADRLGYGAIFVLSLILGLAGAGVALCCVRDPRGVAAAL